MEEVEILSITKTWRTFTSEPTYVIFLGYPIVARVEKIGKEISEIKINIPGIPEKSQTTPIENKVVLYLNEEEWNACKKKFIVGNKVSLKIVKGRIQI
jgi:hypothetical protein